MYFCRISVVTISVNLCSDLFTVFNLKMLIASPILKNSTESQVLFT